MGNYCSQNDLKSPIKVKILKKISGSSISTTVSKLNSVNSMKKHSSELLHFLQTESSKKDIENDDKI